MTSDQEFGDALARHQEHKMPADETVKQYGHLMDDGRARPSRAATFHVTIPLGHPAIRELTKGWPQEDISAAMDDVIMYGNVCVIDGKYQPWASKRLSDV